MTSAGIVIGFTLIAIAGIFLIWKWSSRYEEVQRSARALYEEREQLLGEKALLREKEQQLQQLLYQQEAGILAVLPAVQALRSRKTDKLLRHTVQVLQAMFRSEACGIYQVEGTALKQLYGIHMPQLLLQEEAPSFYKRLLFQEEITIKAPHDERAAPILAGLVQGNGQRYAAVVKQMDIQCFTEHNLGLLSLLLHLLEQHFQGTIEAPSLYAKYEELLRSLLQSAAGQSRRFSLEGEREAVSLQILQNSYEQRVQDLQGRLSSLNAESYLDFCRVCHDYAESGIPKGMRLERLYEQLREAASTGHAYFPALSQFLDELMFVYLKTGKDELAQETAKRMVKQFPKQARSYVRLLEYYFHSGEFLQLPDIYRKLIHNVGSSRIPPSFLPFLQMLAKME
ncbi:hypothetical protein [Ectobacillus ponti]|uniref:Uncharacterized protein n=1 Tax=Ectobacillus ponti TaxID=2961894 RepID=A0AA42BQX3_9BACI|nr:hypothetical protein [Ectobacillus ponti]MCP8970347.1 hypothetical protein [Ectobacillus ponti]